MLKYSRPLNYKAKDALGRLASSPHLKDENLPSAYRRKYQGYVDTDKETEKKGLKKPKYTGDYSKKLQFLMKQAEIYNKTLSGLRRYSVSQLREAEGMYPEYGQYDKVKNSGWVRTKPSSLKKVDGLSLMDRLLIGDVNPFTKKRDFTSKVGNEAVLGKIIKNREAEGGISGPRKKHIDNFNKQLISHLKDYSNINLMDKRNDPISQLVKTQMKNIYDRLEYLTDDKKLEELTGVDLQDKEYLKAIKGRIINAPLNSRGVPATWFKASDHELAKGVDPKNSDRLAFIGQYLVNNPMRYYIDKNTKKADVPYEDFMDPFRGASKLTQDLLAGHRNKLSEFVKMNPDVLTPMIQKDFLENSKLFGGGNRITPIGINGLKNITNQHGDASSSLHTYRPIGMDIIEQYTSGKRANSVNIKPFLSQIASAQAHANMSSSQVPNPYKSKPLSFLDPSPLDAYRKQLEG